jgi:general secretion pathway protein I
MSRGNKAFTFIEVLAALAVVSIALAALMGLLLTSIKTTSQSEMTTQATLLAEEKIAQTLAEQPVKPGVTQGDEQINQQQFHWQCQIDDYQLPEINPNDTDKLHRIEVKVSWQQGSHTKNICLTTYKAMEKSSEYVSKK